MIPVIQTERLTLRAPRATDAAVFVPYYASPRSHYAGGPKRRHEAWKVLAALIGEWALKGHGMWVMANRETDAPIGIVGMNNPDGWPVREIGWAIADRGYEGRGLAREAALRARAYAYEVVGWDVAYSLIHPANHRSVALARRLGAVLDHEDHAFFGERTLVYRHPTAAGLAA